MRVKRIVARQRYRQSQNLWVVWMRKGGTMEDLTSGESHRDSWLIENGIAYHLMGVLSAVLVCMIVMSLS